MVVKGCTKCPVHKTARAIGGIGQMPSKVWKNYSVTKEYDYVENSVYKIFLASDSVSDEILLSCHYRCDRKIIDFNNQKYYNSKLNIKTKARSREPLVYMEAGDGRSWGRNTSPDVFLLPERQCFLDVETWGLASGRIPIIPAAVSGSVFYDRQKCVILWKYQVSQKLWAPDKQCMRRRDLSKREGMVMDTAFLLEELHARAMKDEGLKERFMKTRESDNPISSFCTLCQELGYDIYEMDIISAGEDFYAAMRRSTNGGGENSPKLKMEDDFYEMFFVGL